MQGMTGAELRRFEDLIRENENLKRKISELETQIKQLTKALSEKKEQPDHN